MSRARARRVYAAACRGLRCRVAWLHLHGLRRERPHSAKRRWTTTAGCTDSVRKIRLAPTSASLMLPCFLAKVKVRPVGKSTTETIPLAAAGTVRTACPVGTSHSRAVPSSPADARSFAAGEKSSGQINPGWPWRTRAVVRAPGRRGRSWSAHRSTCRRFYSGIQSQCLRIWGEGRGEDLVGGGAKASHLPSVFGIVGIRPPMMRVLPRALPPRAVAMACRTVATCHWVMSL